MPRLNTGDVLHSARDQYRILKYLGEGLTSVVYEAERLTANVNESHFPVGSRVAMKVLQDGLPDDIQRNFRDEGDVIASLSYEETKAGLPQSFIPGLVERYLEGGPAPQFLAMEFIQGVPLDRLVREEGPLSELDGLRIADQVLTVLDLLHTRLHKSYTDFQLQNVWLLPDRQNVKVMDWNHVSREKNPLPFELVDADLRRMGAYFYQILTGKGAFQDGETAEALGRRAGERWEALSVGTRIIVRSSLNPNQAGRFRSAAEFRDAVRRQNRLWQEKVDDIVDGAQSAMRPVTRAITGDTRLSVDELALAETWVDMAGRRQPDDQLVQYWKETISKATRDVSAAWGSGMQLLGGKQYREAASVLRDEASSWGRVDLWRQVMIAEAAVELGDTRFQSVAADLDLIVGAMNNDIWEEARALFSAQPLATVRGAGVDSLRYEVDAQLAYQSARIAYQHDRWEAAARGFRIADEALPKIAYADVLQMQDGWGAVERLAAEAERLSKDVERDNAQMREMNDALEKDLDDGLSKIREKLLIRPDSPEIIRLCEREAERRPASEAQRLLLAALSYGAIPAEREAILRSAYKEVQEKAREERRQIETKQREAEEARTREEIKTCIQERRWQEAVTLLSRTPLRLTDDLISQVRSAFDAAVDGINGRQASQIAAVLDVADPEGVDARETRLAAQRQRQQAAIDIWEKGLPAQAQGIMAAGQLGEAETLINNALSVLDSHSAVTKILQGQKSQLSEFETIQRALDDSRDRFKNNSLGPDDMDRTLDSLDGRISALGAQLASAKAVESLKIKAGALRADTHLHRARLELDKAISAISARSYDSAESSLADASTILNLVAADHPGFREQEGRFVAAKERLAKESRAGRTFWDQYGKLIVIPLAVLVVLLAAGVVLGWLSSNKEGDARATAEAALSTTDANYNAAFAELEGLRQPNISATQTVEALQNQVAVAAASLVAADASATALAATNEELSGKVTAAQATPEPLILTSTLAGEIPRTGVLNEGVPAFYDLPAKIGVAAPPGWSFRVEPERPLQLVAPDGLAQELSLIYTTLISGTASSRIEAAIPASIVTMSQDTANEVTINLMDIPTALPNAPGTYRIGWGATDENGRRTVGAPVIDFEIVPPPTVVIRNDNGQTYRSSPQWLPNLLVNGGSGQTVEVLGRLDLDVKQTEKGEDPPTPDFLMIRLPGSRAIYWLPSWNAELYGTNGNNPEWIELLNRLPEVNVPDASGAGEG